jgi:trimeric autotransporter adhesin
MRVQRYLLVILAAACLAFGQTYTINTIAGGGLPVNIPGTSAYLGQAALGGSVAVDASGDAFITLQDYNVVVRWASSTQALTLVAGNGTVGFSGDSGPATSAQLNGPSSVAVDSAGNLYISDANNNRVRKVSNGVITTVAGNGAPGFSGDNGPATSAELEVPYGVAVDSVGNLYIADTNNYRIRKVSNGGITTVAGNGTLGFSGDGGPATNAELGQPWGIAVDSAGSLYIADANNLRIRKVSGGVITTIVGNGTLGFSGDGGPATSAELDAPWGVALDSTGNLYIADWMSNSVRKVSNGVINTVAGNGALGFSGDNGPATSAEFHHPRGVAVDSAGNLYIADGSNGRLRRVSNGVITTVAGGGSPVGLDGPASSAQLDLPPTIAADAAGSLYIAEYLYSLVLKVSDGVSTTVAGNGMYGFSGDGGPATSAELEGPYGVAMGSSGNLYIADDTRVREVSNGVITTVAGNGMRGFSGDNGPATSAQLGGATNVAVDAAGNLYISDSGNYRVRKVSNGVISTVAGNGTSGSSGDGGPATSAELSNVSAIAVDSSGNLYVAGTGGVREVSNGIITTVADGGYGFGGDNGPATNAQLRNPSGIAVDSIGSLYIADSGNSRVRKVSNGVITTVAGNGTAGFGGDNGQALSAELDDPIGVAADSAGNVYIADMLNDRVRILAPSGPAACSPASVSPSALSPSASGETSL